MSYVPQSTSESTVDRHVALDDVAVIIPALNEEASLPLVLADLPRVGRVIVVDNGSSDGTAEVARRMGATVVAEPRRGYGAACLRGLAALGEAVKGGAAPPRSGDRSNARPSVAAAPRVVVFLDADYSDYPELLPQLVRPILDGRADFVLGSRLAGVRQRGAMPPQSVFGNRLSCCLMRWLFGARYTDLGPFRAIDYPSLCRLNMVDRNFGWTVEMQIKAARAGLRIHEVAVPYRCRVGKSKISGTLTGTVKAGYKILYTIAKYGCRRA